MKDRKKINWRVYERDRIYPQTIAAYLDLLEISPREHPYLARHYEVMSSIEDYFWWARDLDLLAKDFYRWIKVWLKNKTIRKSFFSGFKKSFIELKNQLDIFWKKMDRIPLISDSELFQIYYETKSYLLKNFFFSEYPVDLFDDFFATILAKHLERILPVKIKPEDLATLGEPAYISQSLRYQQALLALSFRRKVSQKVLEDIAKKYSWVMMSWDGRQELTAEKVRRDWRRLKKKRVEKRQRERQKIINFCLRVKKTRKNLINRYNISYAKIAPHLFLLDKFSLLHDWRKEAQLRSNEVILRCLKEMAKRFKIDYQDILVYFNPEIERLCLTRKRPPESQIKQRRQGVTYVIHEKKIEIFVGKKAKFILNKLVLENLKAKTKKEFSGLPACRGLVTGRAAVVKSAKEAFKKVKKGDILVTSMTTVDYLPAIKIAAGVITDDGGLTCHAAIIARELGIPCVIGTKIATKVLHNGDLVRVNSNHGLISILERKKK